jgi:flagellar biosynthetic protein FliP
LRRRSKYLPWALAILIFGLLLAAPSVPAQTQVPFPTITIKPGGTASPGTMSLLLQIFLLLTVLTLAPAIVVMTTSFTRIVVVFSFLRHALGTQQMPPAQVLIGLSLFLTFFIMGPTFGKVYQEAVKPVIAGKINTGQALARAEKPMREFMFKNTRQKDLALFFYIRHGRQPKPKNKGEISIWTLIPAFIISELKTAFMIGFILYIPFLIIDMVVASVLLSMGMMMLPPIMISLPFKLMLFVLADGWNLLVGSLVKSFG